MSCERALAYLEATIGDTLDPAEAGVADAAASRAHVESCAECVRVRDEIRTAAELATRLYATDPAGDAALAETVTATLDKGWPRKGRIHSMQRIAAAATAKGKGRTAPAFAAQSRKRLLSDYGRGRARM